MFPRQQQKVNKNIPKNICRVATVLDNCTSRSCNSNSNKQPII